MGQSFSGVQYGPWASWILAVNCDLSKLGVSSPDLSYFVRPHSDSPCKYFEADIKGMLGFLVDNIYVVFGEQVFK
jgi:hypothetical protein